MTTSPSIGPGQCVSTAAAIAAAALPAPTTTVLPFGGRGRCGGMHKRRRGGGNGRIEHVAQELAMVHLAAPPAARNRDEPA